MEYKSFSETIKDIDENRIVTGYLSGFGSVDLDGDIMQKGAFSKTIAESWRSNGTTRIKYLLDHNTKNTVGVFQELKEDEFGLFYKARVGTHTAGEDYYRMLKDGIVDQHSVGFSTINSKKDGNHRVITEVKLYEGSGIQFMAANPDTPILSVKSHEELVAQISKFEWALKNGTYSDETMLSIEQKLKSLVEIIQSKNTGPENKSTLPNAEELKQIFNKAFNF